jgi:hypothetical protein
MPEHDPGAGPAAPASQAAGREGSLPDRLGQVYRERTARGERALLRSWAAFGLTFGAARLVTHELRRRDRVTGGSGGIVIGGRHLHHYNFGILALAAVGGVVVHGQEHRREHAALATLYGSGLALIVDELALLLDLADVYWAQDGRTSVDAAIGVITIGGLLLAARTFWRESAHELARTRPGTFAGVSAGATRRAAER